MQFRELFSRYLQKPSVQTGIINHIVCVSVQKALNVKSPITGQLRHHVFYISNKISHEIKTQIYLKRILIIQQAQKKLLEDFGINAIIKDIRIGNF